MSTDTKILYRISLYLMEDMSNDHQVMGELGIRSETQDSLARFKVKQIQKISEKASSFMKVTIDNDALENAIEIVRKDDKHEAMIDDFLDHGASFIMMNELFGLSTREFSSRRQNLGKQGDQHCPKSPSIEEEKEIWNAWCVHKNLPEIERYLETAYDTGLSLKKIRRHIKSLSV